MSYDIELCDPVTGERLDVDAVHHIAGGTYVLGGTTELWLNVTYNYSKHYRAFGPGGIRTIYGMSGAQSIPVIQAVIDTLGDDVDEDDYWNATEGNAKRALCALKAIAELRPDGVWSGD